MKKKSQSTIGSLIQVCAILNALVGVVMVAVMIGNGSVGPAIGAGLVIAFGVVVLLGVAELLHAVMRTAAACEQTTELVRGHLASGAGVSNWRPPVAAAPLYGRPLANHDPETFSEPEQRVWRPAAETKCEACNNFFTLPAKHADEVVCPHCGVTVQWPA